MRKLTSCLAVLALGAVLAGAGTARALDRAGYDDLLKLVASAREAEADVFAPKAWARAQEALAKAEKALATGRKQDQLDKPVAEAREFVENARKATDVCRLALQPHLPPRDRAGAARARELVPAVYAEAEARWLKATEKVESGDVKGGLRDAEAAAPLFDAAELEAIRVAVLGEADRLIAQAEVDEAVKFALATLDRARTARREANAVLTTNRAQRATAEQLAAEAQYEARHASNIAQSVRSLVRNDQAWEKLMLGYEIQMERVGEGAGLARLPFDDGPRAAADTLIARFQALAAQNRRLAGQLGDATARLRQTAARLGVDGAGGPAGAEVDAAALVQGIDGRLDELLSERRDLAEKIGTEQARLEQLAKEHAEVSGQLSARLEREEKFRRARALLTPAEGEVLYSAANDVVLRLTGLAFESGKADLRDAQMPLLDKARTILAAYEGSRFVVEGHTDAAGDAGANQRLSERRAMAVMQYLRTQLEIPADRIQAVGYGAERPVASSQSVEGRAKNRRIDIVIMP
jgi:OmpA-OmpF porin, OOP family